MKKLIIILYLAGMTACAPTNNIAWHQKLQDEASFENRLAQNESFTKKSYKDDIGTLEKKLKELKKKSGSKAELDALIAEITELRQQIK